MALNPRRRARSIDVSERALETQTFREVQTYEQEIVTFNGLTFKFKYHLHSLRTRIKTKIVLFTMTPIVFFLKEHFNSFVSHVSFLVNLLLTLITLVKLLD